MENFFFTLCVPISTLYFFFCNYFKIDNYSKFSIEVCHMHSLECGLQVFNFSSFLGLEWDFLLHLIFLVLWWVFEKAVAFCIHNYQVPFKCHLTFLGGRISQNLMHSSNLCRLKRRNWYGVEFHENLRVSI